MKLIALTGLHGAGKDTVADALPARKLAFADTLYEEVAEAFGVSEDELRCREGKEREQLRFSVDRCNHGDFVDFLDRRYYEHSHGSGGTAPFKRWDRSPRQILQWWGDYRRAQDPEYFVHALVQRYLVSAAKDRPVVITDVRQANEAAMVRQLGGQIWQIVRPGHEPPRTGHHTETDGSEFAPDVVLVNDGALEDLQATALAAWEGV